MIIVGPDNMYKYIFRLSVVLSLFHAPIGFGLHVDAAEIPLVMGVAENADGSQAADATVWLVGGNYRAPKMLAETKTDKAGRFAFTDLDENKLFTLTQVVTLWVTADKQLGWFRGLRKHKRKRFTLRLQQTAEFRGRLVDGKGRPISGATVRPDVLSSKRVGVSDSNFGQLSPEMRRRLTATTDQKGRFVMTELPVSGCLHTTVTVKGFGRPRVTLNLSEMTTLRLQESAQVSGHVDWPKGLKRPDFDVDQELGQVTIYGTALFDGEGNPVSNGQRPAYRISVNESAPINSKSEFVFNELPPGDHSIRVVYATTVPLRAKKEIVQIGAEPGQTIADLALLAARAFRIKGRVLGLVDKQPVAGATIQLYRIHEGSRRYDQRVTTDENGNYVAHSPPGNIRIQVETAPKRYVPLNAYMGESKTLDSRRPTRDVQDDTTWPDLLLDPAVDVEIEVVDEQGNPVPDAVVKVVTPAGYDAQHKYGVKKLTDANGKYLIRRVAANDTLPIRVYSPEAISDPTLVVQPGKLEGPVKIKLSADHGFRFHGKVVDTKGQPIANATIGLGTSYPYVSKWVDSGLEISGAAGSCRTDSRGFFRTGPLWPERNYSVRAKADGYGEAEAPRSRGMRGKLFELAPLVLARSQPPLVGVVVDIKGKPLANVRVFAAGKNWRMATSQTDTAGKFRLEDLAADLHYLFADLNGFRLGGVRFGLKAGELKIVLRRNDEPPRGINVARVPDRVHQLKVVRQLIERAWALPTSPRSTARIAQLEAMVQVDPEFSLIMSQSVGGTFDGVVRTKWAKNIIYNDPDRALQLLSKSRRRSFAATIALGRELAQSTEEAHRKTALQLADLAVETAERRSLRYAPSATRLLTLLGEHERAEQLAERTWKWLEPTGDSLQPTLKDVAVAIAPYDIKKAETLLGRLNEVYRSRTRAAVAVAIARSDPAGCMKILDELKGDRDSRNYRDRTRLRISLEFVADDLDTAIQLVQSSEQPSNRAQALGWLAVKVAAIDKKKAWKLIDEALAVHRDANDAYQGWSNYGGGGPFAAALAYQAHLTGYPDMESVVLHVLAGCRAKGSTKGQDRLVATIATARILGLVDTRATRELLESIAIEEDHIARPDGGVSLYDQWLQAWLLVDFERGANLLTSDLQRLANTGRKDPLRYGHGAVFRLLAAAPHERFKIIIADGTGLWKLDDDGH